MYKTATQTVTRSIARSSGRAWIETEDDLELLWEALTASPVLRDGRGLKLTYVP